MSMPTKVYGTSDDLIEVEGDVRGEVGCYGTDDREHGVLLFFNDGTILEAKYGKGGRAIWAVNLMAKGELFDHIDPGVSEDADPYSDVAIFKDGLKSAYAATEWEVVK